MHPLVGKGKYWGTPQTPSEENLAPPFGGVRIIEMYYCAWLARDVRIDGRRRHAQNGRIARPCRPYTCKLEKKIGFPHR